MNSPNPLRRILTRLATLVLAVCALSAGPAAHAAARTASVSGNWSSTNTWGGSAVPGAADTVTINSGINVTVDTAAVCASLTWASTIGANTTLTISGANTLTVSGLVSMPRPSTSMNVTLAIGAGTVTCGSLTMSATTVSSGARKDVITLSTGTLTVSGTITTGTTGCEITFAGAGTWNMGGAFSGGPLAFTASTGTVNYNGSGNQTIGAFAYNNLIFSGGGNKSMAAGTAVGGNLSIAPTGTAKASVAAGQNLAVGTLNLGGALQFAGTWGSTSSSALNKNDTYFAATTGYLTVASGAPPPPPAGVTGLALWLDAAKIMGLTNGATVTNWTDMSGNTNHAVRINGAPTYQTSVINGKPVVRFYSDAAEGDYLRFPRIDTIRTVFWVLKEDVDHTASRSLFLLGDSEAIDFHRGGDALWGGGAASGYITGGTTRLMGRAVDGTTTVLPRGSFQLVSVVTTGNVQANQITQDRIWHGSWKGDIAEVLIYSRALTTAEEAAVGRYLATKYGLATRYTPATIVSFGTNVAGSSAAIGLPVGGAGAIAWTVPYGTVLSNLAPIFTLSSGTCNRTSGAVPSPNFGAGPVTYTVTAAGVATNVYAVTVTVEPPPGTWSYAPWTGDADSGICSALEYPVAVNTCGDAVTVNGVAFQADAASGANFLIEGAPYTATSGANVTGDGRTLAKDFIYGGNPCTVTLKNLTPGATYETTFFSYGWDAAGTTRIQTFATGSDSLVLDQDLYGQGNGIRISYTFIAGSSSKVVTITPVSGGTFHLSALANRKVTPATILSFGTNVIGSSAVLGRPVGGVAAIAWTVPYSVNLATVAPTYTLTSGTGTPASGSVPSPNFSAGPMTYNVTGGGVINVYTVTATKAPPSTACELLAFNPNLAGSRVVVQSTSATSGTVVVSVPAGTTDGQLAALTPTLTLSPNATCVIPAPPLSLTAPVHYIVRAEDGITTKDYTATVVANAEAFHLFVVKTATTGLASSDYDYLTVVPASRHRNNGMPAVFAVASTNGFTTNIYLQDYLRRYRPTAIHTVNFSATISNFTSSAINAAGPLELSVYMATNFWATSSRVVLVSDALNTTNYPNVLQASALAAALNAPMLYYNSNSAKATLVQNAITQLGATEVVYVNAAGTKPALASLVLTNPATVVTYLAGKGITVDYFAVANPTDLNLVTCAKLSLTAPFVAARRTGIVVPEASWACNTNETMHYTGYPLIKAELQQLYQAIGRYPSYLALVGSAHSIPLGYRGTNEDAGQYYGSPADLDYSDVDADVFPDIAIGRIMAYDIFDATLLASRISTYEQLFDGVWEKTMVDVGGQWNSAYQDVLGANYGFGSTDLIQCLGPTQPVEAAIIGHNDHSSQHVLGGAFDVNSVNVLAPAAIFSQGCATAAIDLDVYNLLVVNQLFKLGAVSFVGSTRSEPGSGKLKQSAMVNALLAGEPLGRGYLAGVDTMSWNGADDQRWNWIFLGDPGLRIHVPSAPVVAPASHAVTPESSDTAILTVNVPSTLFTAEVDPTWCSWWGLTYPEYWGEKAGLYGADVDRFYLVRFTPPRPVLSVEELEVWPTVNTWVWGDVKLGMMGQPMIDYRQDGTNQLVWAIRANIMDWPSSQSTVPLAAMTNDTFRIRYSSGKAITAFNANFPGSSATIQSLSDTNGTVVVYVPPGTTPAQIAALAPTYTLDTGATCNQPNTAGPTPRLSLSTPMSYIVTPQDPGNLPARVYSVSVTTNTPPFRYASWTGDADSGITSASPYTVAVNCEGAAATVNGVAFQASALSGANFAIGGDVQVVDGGSPNITGNSRTLGADFIYDGNPRTVTLLNLTPGKTYETTFFSFGWDASGRTETFASGSESCVIDQDAYGAGNGIRIMYRFVAGSSTKVITITPAAGSIGTFHLCALANREISASPTTTTLALTGGATQSVVGMPLTFTATVTGSAPAGSVTFYAGAAPLGASAVNGSFQASLTTTSLAVGLHQITARYGGDLNHDTSVSAALAIEVKAPILGFAPNPDGTFTLTWTSGRLLEATNVMGPWTTNAAIGPTLTVTPDTSVPQRFYRLHAP